MSDRPTTPRREIADPFVEALIELARSSIAATAAARRERRAKLTVVEPQRRGGRAA